MPSHVIDSSANPATHLSADTPQPSHDELDESIVPAVESEALADRTAKEIFGNEANARSTAGLIASFVASWEQHKHEKSPADWLADEFRRYPDIWAGEEEIVSTANDVVTGVEQADADKASLRAHLDAGRSQASWLAKKIEQGAAAAGNSSVGAYATTIRSELDSANSAMHDAVRTQSGAVNRGPDLPAEALGGQSRQDEWNDITRIDSAKQIGKQTLVNAALAGIFQGARILGRRVWNVLCGKKSPPVSEDVREIFESSVKSAGQDLQESLESSVKTAVSGAVVVAAKSGWIKVLKHTPLGTIVSIVHVAMENAKVLAQLAKGKLNVGEALDTMGICTASAVGGLAAAAMGATIGSVFGPIGSLVGGAVGGVVSGLAGSKIGEAVYEGGKTLVKKAANFLKGAMETVKSVGRAFLNLFS